MGTRVTDAEMAERVIRIDPGDRVLLELEHPGSMTPEDAQYVVEQMKRLWPDNECIVVAGRLRVEPCA